MKTQVPPGQDHQAATSTRITLALLVMCTAQLMLILGCLTRVLAWPTDQTLMPRRTVTVSPGLRHSARRTAAFTGTMYRPSLGHSDVFHSVPPI